MIEGKVQIGWAKTDITPPKKSLLQGQFHTRISRGTISPLTATALAVEVKADNGAVEQCVWLSCDLPGDSCKDEIVAKLEGRCPGLDLKKITINCTHTHCAPPVESGWYEEPKDDPDFMPPPEYRKFLVARLAEVIAAAWKTRAPGAIRRGFGYAVVGRCRRAIYAGGTGRMYGQTNQDDFLGIESCDDHAVNFLFTLDAAGELSGMVINLACPSQCDENDYEFSADFWHNVREGLAARYGAKVHLLPQCAPAGDASPHLLIDQKEEKDLRDRIGVDDKGIIARRILAATEEALATASAPESTLAMAHEAMVVQLPRIMVTRDQYEMEKRIPQLSEEERKQQPWGFQWLWPFGIVCDLVRRYEQQHTFPLYPAEVHIIRLGDVVFATSPFELFMDYGARIRARSKALQTFVVQLADGSGNGFYLPTARALANGHYSAIIKSNWVGPDGGAQLVGETVHVINNFFATEDYPRTR